MKHIHLSILVRRELKFDKIISEKEKTDFIENKRFFGVNVWSGEGGGSAQMFYMPGKLDYNA